MANVSRPYGFRPVKHLTGGPYNGQVTRYAVGTADTVAMAVGDLVQFTGGADADGVRLVKRATTSVSTAAPLVGAVVGFSPDPTALQNSGLRLASTQRYVLVADSPTLIFEAQANAGLTVTTAVGQNAAAVTTAATTTAPWGQSNMQVDATSTATTSTLALKIVGIQPAPINDLTDSTSLKVLVMINEHAFANRAATI